MELVNPNHYKCCTQNVFCVNCSKGIPEDGFLGCGSLYKIVRFVISLAKKYCSNMNGCVFSYGILTVGNCEKLKSYHRQQ